MRLPPEMRLTMTAGLARWAGRRRARWAILTLVALAGISLYAALYYITL
jgi:hypothetical protein